MIKVIKWNGKKITKPGIYSGLDIESYHRGDICDGPSISSTGLRKIFLKSPKAYWDTSPYNPDAEERTETKSLRFGGASHHLLFGQQAFDKLYAVRPVTVNGETWHSSKLVCKGWLSQQRAKGLTVVTPDELQSIVRMSKALAADPAVKAGVLNGYIEHSFFWKDSETGVWLKARPDAIPNEGMDYTDLKTSASVQWRDLQYSIADYAYEMQGAMVGAGCKAVIGQPMASFSLLFIESKRPHDIEFICLKDGEIERGDRANRIALRTFADCMAKNKWPGVRGDRAEPKWLELSEHQKERAENRIRFYGVNHE